MISVTITTKTTKSSQAHVQATSAPSPKTRSPTKWNATPSWYQKTYAWPNDCYFCFYVHSISNWNETPRPYSLKQMTFDWPHSMRLCPWP